MIKEVDLKYLFTEVKKYKAPAPDRGRRGLGEGKGSYG